MPVDKFKMVSALATKFFDLVNGYDVEAPQGVQFQPATWAYNNG